MKWKPIKIPKDGVIPHKDGYLHFCNKCGKRYRYLQDGDIVIHICCEHKDFQWLENDNGGTAKGCKLCGEVFDFRNKNE